MSHLGVNTAYRKNIRVRSFAGATEGKSSVAADHSLDHAPQMATSLESLLAATRLSELELSYDEKRRVLWQFMAPRGRPSFTPGLLCDMTATLDIVESAFDEPAAAGKHPIDFLVSH